MADHIQIGDIAPRIHYAGDGATVAFTYPFPIFQNEDIAVYVDGTLQTLTTQYSVSGAGESAGGTVTFVAAPEDGAAVALVRELTIRRVSDFQASGEFRAKVINDELDFQIAALQQLADDIERSVRLSSSDTGSTLTLPATADRAGRMLVFDDNGNLTTALPNAEPYITMTAFAETLLDDADANAARTTLGAQAADAALTAIAGLTPVEGQVLFFTGGVWSAGNAGGADHVARDMAASVLAYSLAQNDAVSITGGIGKFELSDDFEVDTLAVSTDARYDADGDFYHNLGLINACDTADVEQTWTASSISTGHSTPPGAGIEVVADGDDDTKTATVNGGSHWIKVDLGDGNDVQPTKMRHRPANDAGTNGTLTLEGSNDDSAWTTVLTTTNSQSDQTFDISPSTSYRYWRWAMSKTNTNQRWGVVELELLVDGPATDMTLSPSAASLAVADPTDVIGYFVLDPQVSVTYGTDIVGKASIDGGSTWAIGTWTKVGNIGSDGEELFRLETDVSAQSGASLVYQITTVNNKEVRLHDCVGLVAFY